MKVKIIDDYNIIVFLSKSEKTIDFSSKDLLEDELKELFKKLSSCYDINISGYYNIVIYIDDYYGAILDINREDMDYALYDDDQIDMRILIKNTSFLYLIDDIFLDERDNTIYQYKGKYYLKLEKQLSLVEMGKLLEYSNIVYDNKVEDIIKYGSTLKKEDYVI